MTTSQIAARRSAGSASGTLAATPPVAQPEQAVAVAAHHQSGRLGYGEGGEPHDQSGAVDPVGLGEVAPGTSIVVKLPPLYRKPWPQLPRRSSRRSGRHR